MDQQNNPVPGYSESGFGQHDFLDMFLQFNDVADNPGLLAQIDLTDGWGFEGDQGFVEAGVSQWSNPPDTLAGFTDQTIQAIVDHFSEPNGGEARPVNPYTAQPL